LPVVETNEAKRLLRLVLARRRAVGEDDCFTLRSKVEEVITPARRRARAELGWEDESGVAVLIVVAPRHSGSDYRCLVES
jgi:hypothetical protein